MTAMPISFTREVAEIPERVDEFLAQRVERNVLASLLVFNVFLALALEQLGLVPRGSRGRTRILVAVTGLPGALAFLGVVAWRGPPEQSPGGSPLLGHFGNSTPCTVAGCPPEIAKKAVGRDGHEDERERDANDEES